MKRTVSIFTILLLVIAYGCDNMAEYSSEDIICVSVPQSTKIHMEGLKTCWDKGDEVTVFYRSTTPEIWTFKGETGDVSGQISHESTSRQTSGQDIFVLYPADTNASLEGNVISTEIPSGQTFRKDSYGTALLAAHSDFDILTMKYCTAVMELKYDGPAEISHIVLSGCDGEKISGLSTISFNGSVPQLSCNGETSVTLDCDTVIGNNETVSFYFSIAPGKFSKGVQFMVYFKNGESRKVLASEEFTVNAGHIHTVELLSLTPPAAMDQKVMHLLFSDGSSMQHPFTTQIKFTLDTRLKYEYMLDGATYPFYLYCQTNSSSQFRNTAKGGLYIGGTPGDYIEFPALPGYRLFSVGFSANKESLFHIVPTGDPDTTVEGGSSTDMLEGIFRLLSLTGTEVGKSYTMMLDNNAVFRFITLYYRK